MAEIVTKITNLSYDQYLALTSPEEWGKVAVNVEHMADTDIGYVKEIYVEKGDEVNVYGKLVINDAVYEKIRDYITGCSVELAVVEQKDGTTLSVPTKCSILVGSEPAVSDAGKTILERVYSKIKNVISGVIQKSDDKTDKMEQKTYSVSDLVKLDNIANLDVLREQNQQLVNDIENEANDKANAILTAFLDWIVANIDTFSLEQLKTFVDNLDVDASDKDAIYVILASYSLQFVDVYKRAQSLGVEPNYDEVKQNITGERLKARLVNSAYQNAMTNKAKALYGQQVVYLTMNDDRVRPEHRKLHGTIFIPKEHPELIPPLGYNCRCFIVPLSEVETGNKVQKSEGKMVETMELKYTKLQAEYEEGKALYMKLQKDYSELQEKYDELQKEYNELEVKLNEYSKIKLSSDGEEKEIQNRTKIMDIYL